MVDGDLKTKVTMNQKKNGIIHLQIISPSTLIKKK